MNHNAQAKRVVAEKRPLIATAVASRDHARRVYLESSNRLDLGKLAAAFADAPEAVDYAGKSPKRK